MKYPRLGYRITFAGMVFIAITLFVLAAAVNSQANLLFFTLGLMIAALLASAVGGTLLLRHIDVDRVAPGHAQAGEPLEITYHLTNHKRLIPCFAIRLAEDGYTGTLALRPDGRGLHAGPRQTLPVKARLTVNARGIVQLSNIRASCSFPFGFVQRSIFLPRPAAIVVYPRVGLLQREIAIRCREALTSGAFSSEARGGQDEFYSLREYRPGDNVRAIHWRRTARMGELMVREMTASAPPRMILVLNLRARQLDPAGLARAERAIELAATLLCYGFLENYAVGLFIPGAAQDDLADPQMGRDNRARLLAGLARLSLHTLDTGPARLPSIRGKARSEWFVVTLNHSDPVEDLIPPGSPRTLLPLDHPDSSSWVRFSSADPHPAPST